MGAVLYVWKGEAVIDIGTLQGGGPLCVPDRKAQPVKKRTGCEAGPPPKVRRDLTYPLS